MLEIYRKFLEILTSREKRQGLLVVLVVTLMAVLEVGGVASVMPFLSLLGDPDAVNSNDFLRALFEGLGFKSRHNFLIFLGLGAFSVVLFSSFFKVFSLYVMQRFVQMRRHSIGERLLESYLRQPYSSFLDRNSGDMAKNILSEVDQLIGQALQPGIQVVAYSVVAAAILLLLVAMDPWLAIGIGSLIGGLYALIYGLVRGVLGRMGQERVEANRQRFTTAGEALGGIKAIKLLGKESAYVARFRTASVRFSRHIATTATLGQAPKFIIEAVAIGGVLALAVVLLATRGGVGQAMPILGLYAFAGYKLLPAVQSIFAGVSRLRFGGAVVNHIHKDMVEQKASEEILNQPPTPLKPAREIKLEGVTYTYPNAPAPALKTVNLSIPVGTTVGLVGGTGAGKTTVVDILLGLLRPTRGNLTVDGMAVTERKLRAWQQALGYVPQEIFLSDASVAQNIAFGLRVEEIDHEAVERAARMAQVHDFIVTQLPEGYETVVGERGVRLSGGQRQRIGIARALFHDPEVLVFDEATSALDNLTEQAVMDAVDNLHEQKTIILVAHRLSTVESCDSIFLFEDGEVVARGTYQGLLEKSLKFRQMAAT